MPGISWVNQRVAFAPGQLAAASTRARAVDIIVEASVAYFVSPCADPCRKTYRSLSPAQGAGRLSGRGSKYFSTMKVEKLLLLFVEVTNFRWTLGIDPGAQQTLRIGHI
jgi:hypothetical protein